MEHSNLYRCNLDESNFHRCNLKGANINGATLAHVENFYGTNKPGGTVSEDYEAFEIQRKGFSRQMTLTEMFRKNKQKDPIAPPATTAKPNNGR